MTQPERVGVRGTFIFMSAIMACPRCVNRVPIDMNDSSRAETRGQLALLHHDLFPGRSDDMYSVFPTGVTRYEPDRAHNSYILFDGRDGKTHLIDMNGNDVHTWGCIGFPSQLLDPAVVGGQLGHVL